MSTLNSSSSRMSRHKTMSVSVRRLQDALNMHLDIEEKTEFVDVLNEFHITRDMPVFVKHLKQLLDTPAKKQLLPLIGKVIPKSEKASFDQCLKLDGRKFGTMPSKQKVKSKPFRKDELLKAFQFKQKPKQQTSNKNDKESIGSKSVRGAVSLKSAKSLKSVLKDSGSEVRRLQIKQSSEPDRGFGFSIRGGSEYGIGIYVSMVDEGGLAQKQGLIPGDLLMEVNDISFHKMSHAEAARVIRAARKLDVTFCRVGRIPGSFVVHQMYRWVNPIGRPVSPPPELERLGQVDSVGKKSGFTLLKNSDERKVNVVVKEGRGLGLMIRGGREFGLGIYISGVDPYSVAEDAGLKVGDQILDVNGETYLDITHAEAVRVLKLSKHLIFTIKDVGKLPFGRTTIDKTKWLNHRPASQKPKSASQHSGSNASHYSPKPTVFSKGIGSQLMYNSAVATKWDMIEEQARDLLNNTEQGTLRYYLSEYQKGYITVDGLVLASFELLNTKAKMTLLAEIRNLVQATDLDKFDNLLERRELQEKQGFLPESYTSMSLDRKDRHSNIAHRRSEGSISLKTSRSEPSSRPVSAREQPGRRRKYLTESDLEPLRLAIDRLEDDPDFIPDTLPQSDLDTHRLTSNSRLKSVSTDHLPTYHHNPPSLSSRRSMSVEALTPLKIDTSYHDQTSHKPRSKSRKSNSSDRPTLKIATRTKLNRDSSPRPRVNSSPSQRRRLPVPDSVAHRQRSGSNSSSMQRRHKSLEDLSFRQMKPRRSTLPSRYSSDDDVQAELSSHSGSQFKPLSQHQSPRSDRQNNDNIVYAEIHHQPRVAKDSPSDDSGVEVNGSGNYDTHLMDRVTISRETPVNIDDVLHRRSSVNDTTYDEPSYHGNHYSKSHQSNSFNPHVSSSHNSISSVPPSPRIHRLKSPLPSPRHYPPEIRLNDGEGSIDTMSYDNQPSPKFLSQSDSRLNTLSYLDQSHSRIHDGDDFSLASEDSRIDEDDTEIFDMHSEFGDSYDLYVSPLNRVLDDEEYNLSLWGIMDECLNLKPVRIPRPQIYTHIDLAIMEKAEKESKRISDGKKKYGDIPLEIIPVYKTKPTLGMAIEGGANTRQPLPRVINIQPGGSAYESGGLKVGHVILEVNDESLVGLEHITAAKTIAEAFKNKSHDQMELLVTESDIVLKKQM